MFSIRARSARLIALGLAAALAACGGSDNPTGSSSITVALGGSAASIASGSATSIPVTLTRSNFSGDVTLTLEGAPTGVTASFSPVTLSGATATSTLTLSAATSTVAGTTNLVIRARGTGVADATSGLALTVTAPATPTVSLTFCSAPVLVAYQSGTAGTWTRATGTTTFALPISGVGGIAIVDAVNGNAASYGYETFVMYGTVAELNAYGARTCAAAGSFKTLTGSATGLAAGEGVMASFGDDQATETYDATGTSATLLFSYAPSGVHDLIAAKYANSATGMNVNRLIVRRAQNPAANAVLPVFAFGSAESFAPATYTATMNAVGSSGTDVYAEVLTANGTEMLLTATTTTSTSASFQALPSSAIIAGDLHVLFAGIDDPTSSRGVQTMFSVPGNKTLTLATSVPAVTITKVTATPYPRLRADMASSATVGDWFYSYYQQYGTSGSSGTDRYVEVLASANYFGGRPATWSVAIPDLSSVAGFNATWMLAGARTTYWGAEAYSGNLFSAAADGLTIGWATTWGTTTSSGADLPVAQLAPLARSDARGLTLDGPVSRTMPFRRSMQRAPR